MIDTVGNTDTAVSIDPRGCFVGICVGLAGSNECGAGRAGSVSFPPSQGKEGGSLRRVYPSLPKHLFKYSVKNNVM